MPWPVSAMTTSTMPRPFRDADVDRAAGRRELDGVRQHVPDRLLQAVRVGVDDGSGLIEMGPNRDALGRRARFDHVDGRLDHVLDVNGLDVEPQLAADDPRHVEQIFHQPSCDAAFRSMTSSA